MNKYILLTFFFLTVFSCREEIDITKTTDNEYPTEQIVTASIKGVVVSDRSIPIEEATIQIGEYSQKTDFNGYFYFKNIKVRVSGTTVQVSKSGYKTSRTIVYPQLNSTSYIKVELEYANNAIQFNSSDENKSFTDKTNTVTILGNGFLKGETNYSGELSINWSAIPNSSKNQIGDPIGFDNYFKLKGLNSVGTIGIEITDLNGKNIEIDSENIIELKLNIYDTTGELPEKITMWYFNSEKGKWIEEGNAILENINNGNYYIAEVHKTGFWNFATPFDIKENTFTLKSKNGILPFAKAGINSDNNNYHLSLRADNNGIISCYLPKEETSTINISINKKQYSMSISSSTTKIDIPTKTKSIDIISQLYNCNDEVITDGYITFLTGKDSMFYHINQDGSFSETIVIEENDSAVSWFATDIKTQTNLNQHRSLIDENNRIELNDVYICPESFAIMRYGDEKYLMEVTSKSIESNFLFLKFVKDNASVELAYYPLQGVGKYNFDLPPTLKNNNGELLYIYLELNSRFEITEYNNPGMIRGILECYVRTTYEGTDTTALKIDYSIKMD